MWSATAFVYFALQQSLEPSLGHLTLRAVAFFWMLGALDRSKPLESGVYIRAIASPVVAGEETRLSDETLEHLRSLGYIR